MGGFELVREAIADAITDNTQWQTYAYPPMNPLPNSVIIMPADPYVSTLAIDRTSMELNFTIRLVANTTDNQAGLMNLENLINGVLALLPSWVIFESASAPQEFQAATADLTICDIAIRVIAEIGE